MSDSLPNFIILTLTIEDPHPVTGIREFSGTCTAINEATVQTVATIQK
jgi:hypothetical protein